MTHQEVKKRLQKATMLQNFLLKLVNYAYKLKVNYSLMIHHGEGSQVGYSPIGTPREPGSEFSCQENPLIFTNVSLFPLILA